MNKIESLSEEVAKRFLKEGLTKEVLDLNRKLDDLVYEEQIKRKKREVA